ncbi:MAG TPA: hypothetical protein VFJ01_00055 [Oleiagrimonas sp.]|nr:hypothetical protein [Oleiagrimonas sp.]
MNVNFHGTDIQRIKVARRQLPVERATWTLRVFHPEPVTPSHLRDAWRPFFMRGIQAVATDKAHAP